MIRYTDTNTSIVVASSVHKYQFISLTYNTPTTNIHTTIMSDEFRTQFHLQYIILTVSPLGLFVSVFFDLNNEGLSRTVVCFTLPANTSPASRHNTSTIQLSQLKEHRKFWVSGQ